MKIRRITSLTASLAFVLMVLTSIVLYVVPQGRVAYWADWRLWGLTKSEWGNLHINFGLLFLVTLTVHLYYNWKPLMSYLKDKARRMKVMTPEFNAALVITAIITVGTLLLLPPFSWVMALNDRVKAAGAAAYGEPPYGHAELSSLKTFVKRTGIDLDGALGLLQQAGYPVETADATLSDIGRRYRIPPRKIYDIIRPAAVIAESSAEAGVRLPDTPPPGTGNLTLADFCARHELDLQRVSWGLKQQGIAVSDTATLKEIAVDSRTSPMAVYDRIRQIVNG